MKKAQSEAGFAQAICDLARWQGWRVYRTWNSKHSPPGWPDLVLCRPPELVMAELKRETGRLTPAQRAWLADLEACGIECHLWRPADWDTIEKRLARRHHGH